MQSNIISIQSRNSLEDQLNHMTIAIQKMAKTITNLQHQLIDTQKSRKASFPTSSGIEVHSVEQILRCEADGNYATIYFVNGKKLCIAKTLKVVENLLEGFGFMRCHQSHLVNKEMIVKYQNGKNGFIELKTGAKVPVARNRNIKF